MKRASEFAMVRAQGSSAAGRFLVLSTLAYTGEGAGAKESRFGIITTKRLGHAVVRNLLRRRIREIVRAHGEPLEHGHYVVLLHNIQLQHCLVTQMFHTWVQGY